MLPTDVFAAGLILLQRPSYWNRCHTIVSFSLKFRIVFIKVCLSTISAGARAHSTLFHDENIYFGAQTRKSLTPNLYSAISLLIGRKHCHVLICCLPQSFGSDGDSKLLHWVVHCLNYSVCNCASWWVMQWNTIRLSELLCMNVHAESYLYGENKSLAYFFHYHLSHLSIFPGPFGKKQVFSLISGAVLVQSCTLSCMNYQALCEPWSLHHCLRCHYFLPLWVPISWFSPQFKLFK